ncbi:AMP-binding protein [Kocuria palustris]|nr:AMP-binding protein [Kocuria palustris]
MSVKRTSPCLPLFPDNLVDAAWNRVPFAPQAVGDAVPVAPPTEGYSATYRNRATPKFCVLCVHPELDTFPKLFNNAVRLYGDNPCLGWRPYDYSLCEHAPEFVSLTYKQVQQKKHEIGAGIIRVLQANPYLRQSVSHDKVRHHLRDYTKYGVLNTGRDNPDNIIEKLNSFIVAFFAANRHEWVLLDLACSAYSITSTALYDTLGPDVSKYILNLTELPMVILSKDKVEYVLKIKAEYPQELADLVLIVVMDPIRTVDPKLMEWAKELKVEIMDLEAVADAGRASPLDELSPSVNTLHTISFTSGTTGSKPKGAMLSQANMCAAVTLLLALEPKASYGKNKAFIFLPLTHMYERQTLGYALSSGYYLGFPQLTIDGPKRDAFADLVVDLRIFKPTYFSLVPRILTKFEGLVKNTISELPQHEKQRVEEIIRYKMEEQAKYDGCTGRNPEMDNYPPYKRLQELVGWDEMEWTQTALAPVAGSTLLFLKAALDTGVRQMYGLTETSGAYTNLIPWEAHPGSCGALGVPLEQKLRSVEEMGYSAKENKGEMIVGGSAVFKGYYYNQEETNKVINEDGWIQSGDIAFLDDKGRVHIIDRVKNFFKLSQGEYISPEKIEGRYLSNNPILTQLYIHGNSVKLYLVGVCGVNFERGLKFLNDQCGANRLDMTEHELVDELNKVDNKRRFLKLLNANVEGLVNGYERLHNIYIELNPLTVERNVVTPTMKIKRAVASKYFGKVFDKLYEIEDSLIMPKSKM